MSKGAVKWLVMMWVYTALLNIAKPRSMSTCQNVFPNSCSALSEISLTSTSSPPSSRPILEINFSTLSGSRWSTTTGMPFPPRPETIEETAEMVTARGGKGIPVVVDHHGYAFSSARGDHFGGLLDGLRARRKRHTRGGRPPGARQG